MYYQVDNNHDATSASSVNLDVATGEAMNRLSQSYRCITGSSISSSQFHWLLQNSDLSSSSETHLVYIVKHL